MFIAKHGKECAERFYFHDVVDSYQGMLEHKKYEHRLQEKGPSNDEVVECKREFDLLIVKYGKKYADNYGWAAYLFQDHKRVGFAAIEKDILELPPLNGHIMFCLKEKKDDTKP